MSCPSVWWNLVSYGVHYAELKVNVDAVMEETGGEGGVSISGGTAPVSVSGGVALACM